MGSDRTLASPGFAHDLHVGQAPITTFTGYSLSSVRLLLSGTRLIRAWFSSLWAAAQTEQPALPLRSATLPGEGAFSGFCGTRL